MPLRFEGNAVVGVWPQGWDFGGVGIKRFRGLVEENKVNAAGWDGGRDHTSGRRTWRLLKSTPGGKGAAASLSDLIGVSRASLTGALVLLASGPGCYSCLGAPQAGTTTCTWSTPHAPIHQRLFRICAKTA